jgi:hypothetical protein
VCVNLLHATVPTCVDYQRAQGLQQDQCIAILLISIARKFTVQKSSFLLSSYVTFANLSIHVVMLTLLCFHVHI